ncbi:MAG: 30S ribosomal protein S19e [Candidatus Bathyarchaeia archaeon]
MPTVYDAPAELLIKRLAEHIKTNFYEVTPPNWVIGVKTGSHKEYPPQNKDWWYIRCASLLRKLYLHGPIGVSRLRVEYGGRKRKGRSREHGKKAGGSAIRKPLQQLEKAGLVELDGKKGRKLTSKGRELLDRIATQILKEMKESEYKFISVKLGA